MAAGSSAIGEAFPAASGSALLGTAARHTQGAGGGMPHSHDRSISTDMAGMLQGLVRLEPEPEPEPEPAGFLMVEHPEPAVAAATVVRDHATAPAPNQADGAGRVTSSCSCALSSSTSSCSCCSSSYIFSCGHLLALLLQLSRLLC